MEIKVDQGITVKKLALVKNKIYLVKLGGKEQRFPQLVILITIGRQRCSFSHKSTKEKMTHSHHFEKFGFPKGISLQKSNFLKR